jgi:hypothetical protein
METTKKKASRKIVKRNDLKDCGKLVTRIAGRKIILSPEKHQEILDFILMVAGRGLEKTREEYINNKIRDFVHKSFMQYIYDAPMENITILATSIMCNSVSSPLPAPDSPGPSPCSPGQR